MHACRWNIEEDFFDWWCLIRANLWDNLDSTNQDFRRFSQLFFRSPPLSKRQSMWEAQMSAENRRFPQGTGENRWNLVEKFEDCDNVVCPLRIVTVSAVANPAKRMEIGSSLRHVCTWVRCIKWFQTKMLERLAKSWKSGGHRTKLPLGKGYGITSMNPFLPSFIVCLWQENFKEVPS